MDAARAFIQAGAPLLASQLNASYLLLGTIGWIAQAVRLPFCLISGPLSEKIGRTRVIIPAALMMTAAGVGLAMSKNNMQLAVFYTLAITSLGAFYPGLQALIGDLSRKDELSKNLGAFNLGWCLFAALAAFSTRWIVNAGLSSVFATAAISGLIAGVLVWTWNRTSEHLHTKLSATEKSDANPMLLLISRIALSAAAFGGSAAMMLFPKLGLGLKWHDQTIVTVTAMLTVGQAVAMIATNTLPRWHGRTTPAILSLASTGAAGILLAASSDKIVLGAAFGLLGTAMALAYTSALYYAVADRKNASRNTSVHESLIAGSNILGCLIGGTVAQVFSDRAPYAATASLAFAAVAAVILIIFWFKRQTSAMFANVHYSE